MRTRVRGLVDPFASNSRSFFFLAALLAGALILIGWGGAGAHIVIMKDGFTLKGTIKEEKEILAEGGVILPIGKLGGFRMVDDGARRMIFSHKQAQDVLDKEVDEANADLRFTWPFTRLDRFQLPPGRYDGYTPWDPNWNRTARIKTPRSRTPLEIPQHMTTLTPHYAFVQARRYNWAPHFLTTELDVESIRGLLTVHPNMKLKGDKDDATRRFVLYRFLAEAGFYEAALAELDSILNDMPDQKDKVEKYRAGLKKQLTGQLLDLVELAQKVG